MDSKEKKAPGVGVYDGTGAGTGTAVRRKSGVATWVWIVAALIVALIILWALGIFSM